MLTEIGSYDAKTRFAEILRRVEAGESFTITNRGKPIADMVSNRSVHNSKVQSAIDNIMRAKKPPMSDQKLAELRQLGRK
jgi:prevent-host-death family protein